MILDKFEDVEKAGIVGSLFRATVRFQIETKIFNRLSSTVDKLHLDDLIYLRETYNSKKMEEHSPHFTPIDGPGYNDAGLLASGLVEENRLTLMPTITNLVGYKPTELGRILIEYGFSSK